MGNIRQGAYRIVVPVGTVLSPLTAQLQQHIQTRSGIRGELAFEWLEAGEFMATREEALRLATWAQRLLAELPPFSVKLYGISAQPPGRLFLRSLPSPGQQRYLQVIRQLNDYLAQYELPQVSLRQAFRVPASADCLGQSCFEYLDLFRQLVIEKQVPVQYLQLQRQNSRGGWEPVQNLFLQQSNEAFAATNASLEPQVA